MAPADSGVPHPGRRKRRLAPGPRSSLMSGLPRRSHATAPRAAAGGAG